MAVSPDGQSVYVASGMAIDEFSRSTTTGTLTLTGCIGQLAGCATTNPAGAVYGPESVVVSPDGASVYAASYNASAVDEFSRDTTTGALTFTGCIGDLAGCTMTPAGAASGPFSVAISADGASVYAAANTAQSIDVFSRDTSTGALAFTGCVGQGSGCVTTTPALAVKDPVSVAVSPDGASVYAGSNASSGVDVFSRNTTTGALSFENCIGQLAGCTATNPAGAVSASYSVAVSPDGANVYSGDGGSVLSTFSRASGSGLLTFTGCVGQLAGCATTIPAGAVSAPVSSVVSPDGASVYVAADGADSVDVFSRSTSDGALTFTGCIGQLSGCVATSPATAVAGPSGVAISHDGASVYAVSTDSNVVDLFLRSIPPAPNGGGPGGPPVTTGPPATTGQPPIGPPVSTAPPKITGKPDAGVTLSCSAGSWTNHPTTFAYQWDRNGTALADATSSQHVVQTLDEGTTLTCVVTAANAAGKASAQSKGVTVPIPFVARCPGATGKLSGSTLGLVTLGMTRSRAHYLYRHHSDRGKQYEDFFCLTPIGVRVGYGSPKLLKILSKAERKHLMNLVVWTSTSNPYYSIDGVRPGESIAAASVTLHTEPPFHIGLNYWYLAREKRSTAVLKVRNGVVEEIGIGDNHLTKSLKSQRTFMKSFY